MPKLKKVESEAVEDSGEVSTDNPKVSEKTRLLNLRQQLADLRVNSVSDLDGLIARAED